MLAKRHPRLFKQIVAAGSSGVVGRRTQA
jgi:hypothetical protein